MVNNRDELIMIDDPVDAASFRHGQEFEYIFIFNITDVLTIPGII